MIQQSIAAPIYDRNESIDTVVTSSYSQKNDQRSYTLNSKSLSRAALVHDYYHGEYVAGGAAIGGLFGLLLGGPIGALIGIIGGGVIGAAVDDSCHAKSSYSISRESVASLRKTHPKLASFYSKAQEYALEARTLGYETETAIARFVRGKLAEDEGVEPDELDGVVAAYAKSDTKTDSDTENTADSRRDRTEDDQETSTNDESREKSDYHRNKSQADQDNPKDGDPQEEAPDDDHNDGDSEE